MEVPDPRLSARRKTFAREDGTADFTGQEIRKALLVGFQKKIGGFAPTKRIYNSHEETGFTFQEQSAQEPGFTIPTRRI